jgi:hypothetical protein
VRRAGLLVGALLASACSTGATPSGQPSPKSPSPSSSAERAATPAAPHGGAVLYRPTPGALYALERRDSLTLELPGGGTQLQEFARTAYLTIGIAEASGGYRATIRLDSLRQEPGGTGSIISPDSLLRAEGTTWSGPLTAEGRLGELKADRSSGVADQVGASLAVLFPVLPAAGLQDGAAWSDTAERSIRTDAFDTKERSTTSYRVVKVDNKVYTIDAATGFQRTGTAGQAAQPMEMSSQGTRKSVYRFGADGVVLGAEGADSAEMTITVQAVGQTVPVHQRARWKISKK